MLIVEVNIYRHMERLSCQYHGGCWRFYSLSNGGCFMAPDHSDYGIEAPNGFSGNASGEAAGVIATLYSLSHLSFAYPDNEIFATRFHQLRDFALDHAEAAVIFEAID